MFEGPEQYAKGILIGIPLLAFVFLVALSSRVQLVGTVLLLSLGPALVGLAFLGHLSGLHAVSSWRVFLFGGAAGVVTLLFAGAALVTGTGALAVPGFGASLFAGAAAVLA
ncbi:hypothetical protein [Haloarchaeobius iranensis]|uniref:Uncharacterized protein n=1 Tax=Haloarchaeobius iranensis TaxID=996166 RepID=A0A1G9YV79_9EURY|nr:hypothetical protein [Haloarchaeobius iranensis]SDN13062.1 hypothetical protein SAMN05192554_11655 [Haloarchaeobius iranensis]